MAVFIYTIKSNTGITGAPFFNFYVCDMFALKDIT